MYGLSFLKKMVAVLFLLSGISASFDACGSPGSAENPPNVVFILVDDLGYKDIGCYGSSFYETPNIDQLAREGMKFSNAYAAASVCSPTRASILTGKYPARLKMTNWIPAPQEPVPFLNQLPLEEVTIAEALKVAGYKTYFSGKWHLGYGAYYPEKQGFDENFGGNWRGAVNRTYFSPYDLPNIEDGPEGEYLTDRVTKEAVNFIKGTD
ncbi:MAG: sulfatase, partial [Deltaproteobacteria bacterium]